MKWKDIRPGDFVVCMAEDNEFFYPELVIAVMPFEQSEKYNNNFVWFGLSKGKIGRASAPADTEIVLGWSITRNGRELVCDGKTSQG